MAAIALNKNFVMPHDHKEIIIETDIEKYAGKYMLPLLRPPYMVSFPAELVNENGALFIHAGSGKDIELKSESETKFFYADGSDQQIEFETDSSGKNLRAWHIGWGLKNEIRKID
ncbi:MAG: hypothetical protein IPL46_26740 [Saprospiraceae bacterium]|nr:hypothetical protein [Saprospiraceae bacterium]